jgi:drug/metabolite transporter (DMT)-like permease
VPRSWRLWLHIAVAALFANAVPYLLFAVAEQTVDSSTAGIINATTPLWTVVLALAVRHQKSLTSWQAAGLIVGFAGAVLIFTPWRAASGLTSAGGLECLAASVSYAISYITWTGIWPAGSWARSCCQPASSLPPRSCSLWP